MDFNLDTNDQQEPNPEAENQLPKTEFLADLNTHQIAKVFTNFSKENRTLIIPIGFPQAGKSLLLSSLMYYAIKGDDTLFKTPLENSFPYDKGRRTVDDMIRYFESGKIYDTTAKGTLDLIGMKMEPSKAKLPTLNLAFLDLAGEDIKTIKTSEGAVFTDKINAVFNGLSIDNTPVIFTLITPYLPVKYDNETLEDAHNRENTLHYDFLNYIRQNQPHLLKNSKFFVIVSQWDNNPNQGEKVEDFIRTKRPSVFNYVKDTDVIWGQYSIGKLLKSKIDGVDFQEIVRINYDFPTKFWKKLYHICTGKTLENKSWLQKLLGH